MVIHFSCDCPRTVDNVLMKYLLYTYLSIHTVFYFHSFRLGLLATRILELFVRHACLLRDISEGGKLKLAADMAQIEFAVAPLCKRIEDLGPAYKLFRAFRYVLFVGLGL